MMYNGVMGAALFTIDGAAILKGVFGFFPWWFWVLIAATAIIVIYFKLHRPRRALYEYRRKDCLMTDSEREFFNVLFSAVGNKYYIFPQIHLDAILNYKIVGQSWFGAFRHIDEKSVDFMICDEKTLKPLLAIELDDRSHQREDRINRDVEVERILRDAGMPLLRVSHGDRLNKELVTKQIFEKINSVRMVE